MPPRYTYWTIILEGKPTAFRARTRDELAPTLRQLQARHPDAVMMWFAHGRLWESPEQQREAAHRGYPDAVGSLAASLAAAERAAGIPSAQPSEQGA